MTPLQNLQNGLWDLNCANMDKIHTIVSMVDSLTIHNNMPFTTRGCDNDQYSSNCATSFKEAWWCKECHWSNLNGLYLRGVHESYADGVNWKTGKGQQYSYKMSEMKFRPV